MAYKPKTAEQIFLSNILIRVVECHLLRRKVREVVRNPLASAIWREKLERLDDRIDLLARTYDNNGGKNVS